MGSQVKQVLVVASKTANSERLMKEIEGRAAAEGCRFTLLIPDASDRKKADRTLAVVLPLMRRAAGSPVNGLVDGPDPFDSVQRAVQEGSFDEIIVSTLPKARVEVAATGPHHPRRGAGSASDGRDSQAGTGPDRRSRGHPWLKLGAARERPNRPAVGSAI
jgi:hypothetical protein